MSVCLSVVVFTDWSLLGITLSFNSTALESAQMKHGVMRAGAMLSARHAAERLQNCWHGGGHTIQQLRDSMQVSCPHIPPPPPPPPGLPPRIIFISPHPTLYQGNDCTLIHRIL